MKKALSYERAGSTYLAAGHASGGPFFSTLPEKNGEKRGAWLRLVRSASEFRWDPIFQASFHTRVTLRASYYAPPDTGVPNLQLVALEYLLKIEGADQICWSAPFCGEVIFICSALCRGGALLLQDAPQKAPLSGELAAKG